MKTILNVLLIALLGICACRIKFNGKPCTTLGFDCDSSKLCCGDTHCVNDRCQIEKAKDTLKYNNKLGGRCNPFHLCGEDLRCESHRCVSKKFQDRLAIVAKAKEEKANELKKILSQL